MVGMCGAGASPALLRAALYLIVQDEDAGEGARATDSRTVAQFEISPYPLASS